MIHTFYYTPSCSGCHSKAPCSGSSRRSGRRAWGRAGGSAPGDPRGDPGRCPARPTHHDHSHHDGGDADEVYSFPEKSSSIFPWQSSCGGGQTAFRGARPQPPARPWPRVIAAGAQRGTALPPRPSAEARTGPSLCQLLPQTRKWRVCRVRPLALKRLGSTTATGLTREARAPPCQVQRAPPPGTWARDSPPHGPAGSKNLASAPRQSSPNSNHSTAQYGHVLALASRSPERASHRPGPTRGGSQMGEQAGPAPPWEAPPITTHL